MNFEIFLIIFFAIVAAWYFIKYQQKRLRLCRMVNKFDGPKTIPLLGNLNLLTGSNTGKVILLMIT